MEESEVGVREQLQLELERISRENERLQAEWSENARKQEGLEAELARLKAEASEVRMGAATEQAAWEKQKGEWERELSVARQEVADLKKSGEERAEREQAGWEKQKWEWEKELNLARQEIADLKKSGEERAEAARLREEALRREVAEHLGRLHSMTREADQLRKRIRSLEALPQGQVPEMWAFSGAPPAENRWIWSAAVALAVGALVGAWGAGRLMQGGALRSTSLEPRGAMVAARGVEKEPSTVPAPSGHAISSPELPPNPEPPKNAQTAATASEGTKEADAGLPQSFQGVQLGEKVKDFLDRQPPGLWRERNGRFHRKSELEGAEVEAVLMPDRLGRLVMGAYVRVCGSEPEKLAPFLEWAVSVQEDLAERHGEPSQVHQVQGVSDAQSVVAQIAAGADYYESRWQRPMEDGEILLSVRSLNERSVVFRLEIRSAALARDHFQSAAPSAEAPSNPAVR